VLKPPSRRLTFCAETAQKAMRIYGVSMAKTPAKKIEKNIEELSYEEALSELEGIVSALEDEQNPLEESMKLFERGQALVTHCSALLESAQLKVQKLAGESLTAFEEESE
jgi:exodeoxyribonuclease VII small subunit